MYLLSKLGGHRSYRSGDANPYINFYLNILEKAELPTKTTIFSDSAIPIYNSKVQEKFRRGKKFSLQANTIILKICTYKMNI